MILDGQKIKNEILEELKEEVSELETKPHFAVVQVGNNEASNIYIKRKRKMAEYIGYIFDHLKFPEDIPEDELITKINDLNNNPNINGIMVQLPLPKHIDTIKVQNVIKEEKDIDGLSNISAGKLLNNEEGLYSCTPMGVMEILKRYNINLRGLHAVVIGTSSLVGKPMGLMLINAGATVTYCNSKTIDLSKHTKEADLIVSAVGKPNLITSDMVKENAIVIDVGITRTDEGIKGDTDFENISKKAKYITPVPGGVGPMTIAMLAKNILTSYKIQNKK